MNGRPNIVLVHGAWADGSCWSAVLESLQADGYTVTAPQFPETSLADDVARLRQVLEFQDGPTIAVGHSYGGQIITALGSDAVADPFCPPGAFVVPLARPLSGPRPAAAARSSAVVPYRSSTGAADRSAG